MTDAMKCGAEWHEKVAREMKAAARVPHVNPHRIMVPASLQAMAHRLMKNPYRGTLPEIQDALRQFMYVHIPLPVLTAGLVLTMRDYGWRGWVLRVALWALDKAGHTVVKA